MGRGRHAPRTVPDWLVKRVKRTRAERAAASLHAVLRHFRYTETRCTRLLGKAPQRGRGACQPWRSFAAPPRWRPQGSSILLLGCPRVQATCSELRDRPTHWFCVRASVLEASWDLYAPAAMLHCATLGANARRSSMMGSRGSRVYKVHRSPPKMWPARPCRVA